MKGPINFFIAQILINKKDNSCYTQKSISKMD